MISVETCKLVVFCSVDLVEVSKSSGLVVADTVENLLVVSVGGVVDVAIKGVFIDVTPVFKYANDLIHAV